MSESPRHSAGQAWWDGPAAYDTCAYTECRAYAIHRPRHKRPT